MSERNPDEFSFGMLSSSVDKHGRKVQDRGNKSMGVDVVKLLKTQDAGYVRTLLQMVRKEKEELEQRLVIEEKARALGVKAPKSKHTVYVGNQEEQEEFDDDEWFGKGGEWPDKVQKRQQSAEEEGEDDDDEEDEDEAPQKTKTLSKKQREAQELAKKQRRAFESKRERGQERAAAHLEAVKARERALMEVEEELELQRAKMSNSVGGVNKNGVKFKIRERKR